MEIKELEAEGLTKKYQVTIPKEDLSSKLDAKIKEIERLEHKSRRPDVLVDDALIEGHQKIQRN